MYPFPGEPEDDPRPLEGTVSVRGLVFSDRTAVGEASWIDNVARMRKVVMKETLADLDLLSRIAHLEDAKAVLSPRARRLSRRCGQSVFGRRARGIS